ncbi:TIGR03557 family F420-dependent LLM class oxidoreductase [Cellulomonas dongxiuzhuiae]|uniref:TIGR03557 family F420-dependent LLM class oxidoreductase n=1 Tax=Cellulomonas dongxiuzhuiae TaxID=2819979 RepID=A0ABX8GHW6_9CELL|nr:TIGR03557 family F420-dependent LLM class oxidoreductase [Cellulomonas dongxiuzhuiae]MBO3094799.1 TIGR03557 family F420-dependent LLM class oxidoreductase [Cellulomonas dongxiuzhuiae]QWC15788.1 TIGR03557 family F420-dependent LLM class oxidoreductase [Cellulomonas dongxiuzhuiae]
MTRFGYTLMTEQSGPRELVRYAQHADRLGFDFAVSSDHFFPWLDEQGHAPYAWSVLGAVAQATERIGLMTYVTCPTVRYHPAVVAQKAATMALLSQDRFTLGVGAGENLNEHVVGERWPAVGERHDMLEEALEIIHELLTGDRVTYEGAHFRVDSAKLWDIPEVPVPIGVAVSGAQSVSRFSGLADHLIAVEPDADLVRSWDEAREGLETIEVIGPSRKIGQIPISWGPDRDEAVARAHEQFRWFGGGWKVNADLPTTESFDAASQFVRPEDVAESIPCGPDLDAVVEAVSAYWEAGFTDVAVVQVGDALQQRFLDEAAGPLLEKLRAAAPSD